MAELLPAPSSLVSLISVPLLLLFFMSKDYQCSGTWCNTLEMREVTCLFQYDYRHRYVIIFFGRGFYCKIDIRH